MPIREGRPADLAHLAAVQAELSDPSPDLLAAALSGVGLVLVSTADGRPVGYLVAVPGADTAHVAELAVHPDHRREGRATALLESAIDRLGVRRVTLTVAPDNDPARRCYESVGFVAEGRIPDHFDGEPALVMAIEPADGAAEGGQERPPGERDPPD